MSTLAVRPGLAGVSSIYNYTHGEKLLVGDQAEEIYARELLPTKLALEVVYLRHASLTYDLRIIGRTIMTIAAIALGKTVFADPPEMQQARQVLLQRPTRPLAA